MAKCCDRCLAASSFVGCDRSRSHFPSSLRQIGPRGDCRDNRRTSFLRWLASCAGVCPRGTHYMECPCVCQEGETTSSCDHWYQSALARNQQRHGTGRILLCRAWRTLFCGDHRGIGDTCRKQDFGIEPLAFCLAGGNPHSRCGRAARKVGSGSSRDFLAPRFRAVLAIESIRGSPCSSVQSVPCAQGRGTQHKSFPCGVSPSFQRRGTFCRQPFGGRFAERPRGASCGTLGAYSSQYPGDKNRRTSVPSVPCGDLGGRHRSHRTAIQSSVAACRGTCRIRLSRVCPLGQSELACGQSRLSPRSSNPLLRGKSHICFPVWSRVGLRGKRRSRSLGPGMCCYHGGWCWCGSRRTLCFCGCPLGSSP